MDLNDSPCAEYRLPAHSPAHWGRSMRGRVPLSPPPAPPQARGRDPGLVVLPGTTPYHPPTPASFLPPTGPQSNSGPGTVSVKENRNRH